MIDYARALSFDDQAALYDRIRPHYPDVLFQTLTEVSQLKPSSKLLEIGPGTGQATEPMARRGFTITGVEPGEHLAAVARKKFADNARVKILTSAFEDVDLPAESFDLVYSATAFHWISPEARYAKTHRLLKQGGYLAVIHTNHVSDEQGDKYFYASRPIHERFTPQDAKKTPHMIKASEVRPPNFDPTLYRAVLFAYMPVVIRYDAQQYVDLQHTYSPVLTLSPQKQEEYLRALKRLIETEFDGFIDKHFAMSLAIAKAI